MGVATLGMIRKGRWERPRKVLRGLSCPACPACECGMGPRPRFWGEPGGRKEAAAKPAHRPHCTSWGSTSRYTSAFSPEHPAQPLVCRLSLLLCQLWGLLPLRGLKAGLTALLQPVVLLSRLVVAVKGVVHGEHPPAFAANGPVVLLVEFPISCHSP